MQHANIPALASLVCGVLGCIPFVMSLAAIVLAVVGLWKLRTPNTGGKTLATIGIVLGVVGLIAWSSLGGVMLMAYQTSKPARVVANQFAIDLSTGNINGAVAASHGMTPQQLNPVAQEIQPWGAATSTSFSSFKTRVNVDGTTICDLSGTATFTTGGQKQYSVRLVRKGGPFKVQSFNFQ
jgi:hypothetical protein